VEPRDARWHKSTFSSGNGASCIEVAVGVGGAALRDTKDRSRAAHRYPIGEWRAFLAGVRAGQFGAG
jgi:hypothetical protein